MGLDEKLQLLESEIDERVIDFDRRRRRDRTRAFGTKMVTVILAGIITVLLGLNLDVQTSGLFKNVALGLGALITVANAIEAFYDHRSLWIREYATFCRLLNLKGDLKYYAAGIDGEKLSPQALEEFKNRFHTILEDDFKAWLKLREGSVPVASE